MTQEVIDTIAKTYNWQVIQVQLLLSGLINTTCKIQTCSGDFILQKVNTNVFTNPFAIDDNIKKIAVYLKQHNPNYLFIAPIACINGHTLHKIGQYYYRVFNYVHNSCTINVVENEQQTFEAAKQFGKLSFLLSKFPVQQLQQTLPNFHNLNLRYNQFLQAVKTANATRLTNCKQLIANIELSNSICKKYQAFITNTNAIQRVAHHDTKISNVLFNANGNAICVIDLDTMMPGYFFSDVGDMIRTYVCAVSEEENDYTKIVVRKPFLKAIQEGYLYYMQQQLSKFELEHFFFAGEVLIYMQALRFATDYLNNDVYYSTTYSEQNFVRATNQMHLLRQLQFSMQ